MKLTFNSLRAVIRVIAFVVFAAGVVLTLLGVYDFFLSFTAISLANKHGVVDLAIGLLRAVDLFLIAIVFFVLSLGMLVLFNSPDSPFPLKLPEWLRVKNFMQLKIILWEAVLTSLVVAWLAGLVEQKYRSIEPNLQSLVIPGGILMLAISLYFLKKGE
jgi:uncharacterized membrane protein YqhA